jgi:hypothetical protein
MLETGGTLETPLAQLQVQRERVQEQLAALDEGEQGPGGSIVETDV